MEVSDEGIVSAQTLLAVTRDAHGHRGLGTEDRTGTIGRLCGVAEEWQRHGMAQKRRRQYQSVALRDRVSWHAGLSLRETSHDGLRVLPRLLEAAVARISLHSSAKIAAIHDVEQLSRGHGHNRARPDEPAR